MRQGYDEYDEVVPTSVLTLETDFTSAPLEDCMAALAEIIMPTEEPRRLGIPWSVLAVRFPESIAGDSGVAKILRAAKFHDEADAALAMATTLRPNDIDLALDYANASFERGEWSESVARLASLIGRFPALSIAHALMIDSLSKIGAIDAARHVCATAQLRFPDDIDVAFAGARLMARAGDAPAAVAYWRRVSNQFSHHPDGHIELAINLRIMGNHIEANDVITNALTLFPENLELLKLRPRESGDEKIFLSAVQYWSKLVERAPDNLDHQRSLAGALEQAGNPGSTAVDQPDQADQTDQGLPDRALFMSFESLGHSCEFGLVQRYFGAEPVGLLRWSGIDPDELLAALIERFAGVGDPAETQVIVSDDTYMTMHARYYMQSHTFIFTHEVEQSVVFDQQCRRLGFLRRKLLSELTAGRKVFVYAHAEQLTDPMIKALDAAIRAYNDEVTTLFVRLGDEHVPPGEIRSVSDRCFLGGLTHFETGSPAHDEWLSICRAVATARQDR